MVEVAEADEEALNPIDPNSFIRDGFRDALFRSQEVRGRLWELVPRANDKLRDILDLSATDEKTLSTQFNAAKFVIENNLVKFPEISHKTVNINDKREKPLKEFKPITRQEVIEAAAVAAKAQGHRGDDGEEG